MSRKPETKVTAGSLTAIVTGAVSWVLVHYVFHHALSAGLQTALPVVVSWVLGTIAAYFAPHTPAPAELPPSLEVVPVTGPEGPAAGL